MHDDAINVEAIVKVARESSQNKIGIVNLKLLVMIKHNTLQPDTV